MLLNWSSFENNLVTQQDAGKNVLSERPQELLNWLGPMAITASHCKISGLALIVADNLLSRKIVIRHIT